MNLAPQRQPHTLEVALQWEAFEALVTQPHSPPPAHRAPLRQLSRHSRLPLRNPSFPSPGKRPPLHMHGVLVRRRALAALCRPLAAPAGRHCRCSRWRRCALLLLLLLWEHPCRRLGWNWDLQLEQERGRGEPGGMSFAVEPCEAECCPRPNKHTAGQPVARPA